MDHLPYTRMSTSLITATGTRARATILAATFSLPLVTSIDRSNLSICSDLT